MKHKEEIARDVLQKAVDGLREEGCAFVGVLFAGIMLTAQGPRVLEFKVTRPSFFGGVPSYFEALWYPHLYVYRKSNT